MLCSKLQKVHIICTFSHLHYWRYCKVFCSTKNGQWSWQRSLNLSLTGKLIEWVYLWKSFRIHITAKNQWNQLKFYTFLTAPSDSQWRLQSSSESLRDSRRSVRASESAWDLVRTVKRYRDELVITAKEYGYAVREMSPRRKRGNDF